MSMFDFWPTRWRKQWLSKCRLDSLRAQKNRRKRMSLEKLEDRWLPSQVTNTLDSGAGSLRQAILDANASPGSDITFDIGSGGSATIIPLSPLPLITASGTTIDGTTQPGYSQRPLIILEGATTGQAVYSGLTIAADNCTVRGLVVNSFSNGVVLEGSSDIVQGCYLGTDSTGSVAVENSSYGLFINGGSNDTVGGTTAGTGNIASGNGEAGIDVEGANNLIEGNICGLDYTGMKGLPNRIKGIAVQGGATGNTIGGTASGAGNVCSDNGRDGLYISDSHTTGNVAEGNIIGLNVSENSTGGSLGNGLDGVLLTNATSSNTIGPGNIISGNYDSGIHIANNSSGNTVEGSYIGTTPANFASNSPLDLSDRKLGIFIDGAGGNTIGGLQSGDGNIIDAKGTTVTGHSGILIANGGSDNNVVEGNYIADDTGFGVRIGSDANDNIVGGLASGAGNTIEANDLEGVEVDDSTGTTNSGTPGIDNAILGNSIASISTGTNGIALVDGGNQNAPSPVLSSAIGSATSIKISGSLVGAIDTTYDLEFFSSAADSPLEGQTYLNWNPTQDPTRDYQVNTGFTGTVDFTVTLNPLTTLSPGVYITATATSVNSSGQPLETSQFSSGIPAQIDDTPPTSSVIALPTYSKISNFTIDYTASDPGSGASGLAEVDIYAKGPTDGGYTLAHAFTGSNLTSGSFNYVPTEGDGTYSYYSIATDNVGNVQSTPSTPNASTLLDTTAPTSSTDSLPVVDSDTFTVGYSASDPGSNPSGLKEVDIYAKGPRDSSYTLLHTFTGSNLPGGSFGYSASEGDGTYSFYGIGTDLAGNVQAVPGSPSSTTLVDTTQPTSSASSPTYSNASAFAVSYTASDPSGNINLSAVYIYAKGPTDSVYTLAHTFTGSSLSSGSFSYQPGEGDGTYSFYSIASDKAGYTQSQPGTPNATTLRDATKPTSAATSPSDSSSSTFTVGYAASDPGSDASGLAGVKVYVEGPSDSGYTLAHTFAGSNLASGSFSYTAVEGDGNYSFYSIATDDAGNVQNVPASADATTFLGPTSTPSSPNYSTSNSIAIDYSAGDPNGPSNLKEVDLYVEGPTDSSFRMVHAFTGSNLSSGQFTYLATEGDGSYAFYTMATDATGFTQNVSSSAESTTFLDTVVPTSETTSPTFSTSDTFWVDYTGDDPGSDPSGLAAAAVYVEGPKDSGFSLARTFTGSSATGGTFDYTASEGDGTYTFYTVATDEAGNAEVPDLGATSTLVDTEPPTSTASSQTLSKADAFTVSYAANDPGTDPSGLAGVNVYVEGPTDNGYHLVRAFTGSNLHGGNFAYAADEGDGNYSFYSIAADVAGNYQTVPGTANTTTLVDTTPPNSAASSPTYSNSATIDVGYTASDPGTTPSGVGEVDLYVEGPTDSSFTLTHAWTGSNLASGNFSYPASEGDGDYAFYTIATDAAGNRQTVLGNETATFVDTIPPTSTASSPTDSTSASFNVSFTASDPGTSASGLAQVNVYAEGPTDHAYKLAHTFTGSSLGSGTFSYTASEGDGSYSFYSIATDAAGNAQSVPSAANAATLVDTTLPTSRATTPSYSSNTTFAVNYAASDPGADPSGLEEVTVYVEGPTDSSYQPIRTFTGSGLISGSFDFTASEGVGSYKFYSIATDSAGNTQQTPVTDQSSTLVGTATHLVISLQPPASIVAGSGFAVSVAAEDASGNLDRTLTGTVTLSLSTNPGKSTLGGVLTVPFANGVASFTGLTLNGADAGYTLQATGSVLSPVTTNEVAVVPAAATHLAVIAQPPAEVAVAAGISFIVAAEDPFGNINPSFDGKIGVSLASPVKGATLGGTLTATAQDGMAILTAPTLNKLGNDYVLKASTPTLSSAETDGIDVVALTEKGRILQGNAQTATVNSNFHNQLEVAVTGATGKPVANVPVTFDIPVAFAGGTFQGTGTPTSATVNTNDSGVAIAPILNSNITSGTYAVLISIQGILIPARFTETNQAGSAASIAIAEGANQTATVGAKFALPLQAIVKDAFGNVVPNAAVTFTAPASGPGGTFSPTGSPKHATVKTSSTGIATAPAFTANGLPGSYAVNASVGSASASITESNSVGAPDILTIVGGSGQSAAPNAAFAESLQVKVTDRFGNALANVPVTFLAPTQLAGGTFATTGSPATIVAYTDSTGVATSPVLVADDRTGTFTVTASLSTPKKSVSFREAIVD